MFSLPSLFTFAPLSFNLLSLLASRLLSIPIQLSLFNLLNFLEILLNLHTKVLPHNSLLPSPYYVATNCPDWDTENFPTGFDILGLSAF
jgi:hypothetical protein